MGKIHDKETQRNILYKRSFSSTTYDAYDNFCWHKHYEWVDPISSPHYNGSGQHGYGGNLGHHQSHGQTIVMYVLEFETVYFPGDCP